MKLISSEKLLETSIFTVTQDHALDPDGFEIKRAIVQHGGSAVMMPVAPKTTRALRSSDRSSGAKNPTNKATKAMTASMSPMRKRITIGYSHLRG